DDEIARAREAFRDGATLVKRERWAEAMAAFERSVALKPHAVTLFNIGYCQRALGQYTRAHATFSRALAAHDASRSRGAGELSESLLEETRGYLAELDGLFARATVTLTPPDVTLSVDG